MTNSNDLTLTIQHQLLQLVESSLRQSQILEENSEQIGRLTEGLTEIKLLIQEQGEITKQTAEVTKQNAEVAKQQAEGIERLSRVVERQSATADRLSLVAEQFFRERQS